MRGKGQECQGGKGGGQSSTWGGEGGAGGVGGKSCGGGEDTDKERRINEKLVAAEKSLDGIEKSEVADVIFFLSSLDGI